MFPLSQIHTCPTLVDFRGEGIQRSPHYCGAQRESEWAQFVDLLVKYRCTSILFLGVADGGNQWYIAHRYRDLGWPCKMRLVDIRLTLGLINTLRIMRTEYPNLEIDLIIANSQQIQPGELGVWDAAFVDGDHGLPQTLHDVRIADAAVLFFTGVHDVTDRPGHPDKPSPSVAAWQQIKKGRRVEEFFTDWQMGIGVLYKDGVKP